MYFLFARRHPSLHINSIASSLMKLGVESEVLSRGWSRRIALQMPALDSSDEVGET